MGSQIEWVKGWGCQAVYINEQLILELDEIRVGDVIPLMMHQSFEQFTTYRASDKWLEDNDGNFPQNLREVVEQNGKTIAENWEQ
jgi:hypothetical protein